MTARWISVAAAVALVAVLGGCGARSSYLRESADAEELVWAYDDGLELTTGTNVPVAEAPGWDGLSGAVGCVDDARAYAEEAESLGSWASIASWTAVGVIAGGAGVTSGLLLLGVVGLGAGPGPLIVAGALSLLVVGGTAAASVALLVWAADLDARALPAALDAVNVYNDRFAEEPACRRREGPRPASSSTEPGG